MTNSRMGDYPGEIPSKHLHEFVIRSFLLFVLLVLFVLFVAKASLSLFRDKNPAELGKTRTMHVPILENLREL